MDLYDPRERSVSYTVPKWITFWRSYPLLERTLPGAVFYNISLGKKSFKMGEIKPSE
jgi:hypothetical protein